MHPFLYGFWICFGPNLLVLFALSTLHSNAEWETKYAGYIPYLQIVLWVAPVLGLAYILVATRNKLTRDYRNRLGLNQVRGAVVGTAGSLALVVCLLFAAELRTAIGLP